ncbi:MAG: NADPH-dependent FMN reductase [Bordetella sp.]|uniref:NADPH-dependent FMN reductase n=1 Tax=Bordetella sp. TaxID=28081 RepID=UPI003F7B4365
MSLNVAVIVGSLRKGSFNRSVALAVKDLAAPRMNLNLVEIGDLPLYNPDLDESAPAPWARFRGEVAAADAVLFVTPEYNRSIPGALKNAIDVGSRPYGKSVWQGKPAAIISVSPGLLGAFGANHHLRQPLVFLDMPILQQPEMYLSKAGDFIGEDGEVNNEATRDFLKTFAGKFADWIEKNRAGR